MRTTPGIIKAAARAEVFQPAVLLDGEAVSASTIPVGVGVTSS